MVEILSQDGICHCPVLLDDVVTQQNSKTCIPKQSIQKDVTASSIYPYLVPPFFPWRFGRLRNPTQAIGVSFFFVSFNLVNGSLVATADTTLFDRRMPVCLGERGGSVFSFGILSFPSIQSLTFWEA